VEGHLQRRIRQLESEADGREEQLVGQLRADLHQSRQQAEAQEREVVELRSRLEESEHYVQNVVKTAMGEQ
jgi:hypothetical protein